MEFKNTIEVLYAQAKEIEDIAAKIEQSDEIPFIEIDRLLEKLRNIYDLTLDLRSAMQGDQLTDREKALDKNKSDSDQDTTKLDKTEEETSKTSTETIREKVGKNILDKKPEKTVEEKKFVSDQFKSSDPILNEEISEKSKFEDITSQYKTKPIGSIKSALGLNEKFELINHLFDGDKDKFERTMEVLETASSFVEAYNYLEGNFEWDMDDAYVQRILELIRRKLIVRRNE